MERYFDDVRVFYPIQWYEGMLLGPQHLQTNDRLYQSLMRLHWSAHDMDHYGVIELRIDTVLLNRSVFCVEKIKAIFPDSLPFSYDSSVSGKFLDLSLDISFLKSESAKQSDGKSHTYIYLVIPLDNDSHSNINADLKRFISIAGEEIADINMPDNKIEIGLLYPKVFLSSHENIPAGTTSFPIAKVTFFEENYILESFTPACFYLPKHHKWYKRLVSLVTHIRQKIGFLNERMQTQNNSPALVETASLLKNLVSGLPELEVLALQNHIIPKQLYWALVRSIASLLPLNYQFFPPILPVYNHNNIDEVFNVLTNTIDELLNSIQEGFITISFNQQERRFFLKLSLFLSKKKLFLGVCAQKAMSEYQLEEWMNDAIICSDSLLESTFSKRITGAKRRMVPTNEVRELNPSRGVLIYEISTDDPFIILDEPLNIINPADTLAKRPRDIILYQKK
jgi:type VI secretion system protein ImpJ